MTLSCVAREHGEAERLLAEAERWLAGQDVGAGARRARDRVAGRRLARSVAAREDPEPAEHVGREHVVAVDEDAPDRGQRRPGQSSVRDRVRRGQEARDDARLPGRRCPRRRRPAGTTRRTRRPPAASGRGRCRVRSSPDTGERPRARSPAQHGVGAARRSRAAPAAPGSRCRSSVGPSADRLVRLDRGCARAGRARPSGRCRLGRPRAASARGSAARAGSRDVEDRRCRGPSRTGRRACRRRP